MSYVWGGTLVEVSGAEELPTITDVEILTVEPSAPKVGQDVRFVVRVWFDRVLPKDLRLRAVVTVLRDVTKPCHMGQRVAEEVVNAFAGFKYVQREFRIRFSEPGTYKVCFGFKPEAYKTGPGR